LKAKGWKKHLVEMQLVRAAGHQIDHPDSDSQNLDRMKKDQLLTNRCDGDRQEAKGRTMKLR
jgi:hypothetical protein